MKKIVLVGLKFRLCTVSEAEEVGCKKIHAPNNPPTWQVARMPDVNPLFSRADVPFNSIAIKKITIDLNPRTVDNLLCMKEFYDCFKDVETIEIDGKPFNEIDSLFRDEKDPKSPYSQFLFSPEPYRTTHNYGLSHEAIQVLNSAVERIYNKGHWSNDYVNLFIVRSSIIIFVGRPVYYAQTDPLSFTGEDPKIGFGYVLVRPGACLRLRKK